MGKSNRSLTIRLFNSVCAIALIVSLVYLTIAGLQLMAVSFVVVSLGALAVPVIVAGANVLEVFVGIFEAIVEGILAIFEAIASAIGGLFG